MDLLDTISSYLKNEITHDIGRLYFGDLTELSSEHSDLESVVALESNRKPTGYVRANKTKPYYQVSLAGEKEGFTFQFYPHQVIITVRQYQITKEPAPLQDAIEKEDWVDQPPYLIVVEGDYSAHRKTVETAIDNFLKGDRVQLWIPDVFLDNVV